MKFIFVFFAIFLAKILASPVQTTAAAVVHYKEGPIHKLTREILCESKNATLIKEVEQCHAKQTPERKAAMEQ